MGGGASWVYGEGLSGVGSVVHTLKSLEGSEGSSGSDSPQAVPILHPGAAVLRTPGSCTALSHAVPAPRSGGRSPRGAQAPSKMGWRQPPPLEEKLQL